MQPIGGSACLDFRIPTCRHAQMWGRSLNQMKTNYLAIKIVTLLTSTILYSQEVPKWGESGAYTKWYRYSYDTGSRYEFVASMPTIDQFPKILELAQRPDATPNVIDDREIAISQLRTISRCKFDKLLYSDSDVESENRAAIAKWQQWWEVYGKTYAANYRQNGKRYPAVWAKLPGTKDVDCPSYEILLPETWSTVIEFRSGDYGGVTEELISFSVSKSVSRLTRKFRHGWPDQSEWKYEEWKDITFQEAQDFLTMVIYSIDNPWLYSNESFVSDRNGKRLIGSVRGRPKEWSNYYPRVEWSGILDGANNVIINDDVWSWHTNDYDRFDKTMFNETIGVAYRVVLNAFPDPTVSAANSRWVQITEKQFDKPIDAPKAPEGR